MRDGLEVARSEGTLESSCQSNAIHGIGCRALTVGQDMVLSTVHSLIHSLIHSTSLD